MKVRKDSALNMCCPGPDEIKELIDTAFADDSTLDYTVLISRGISDRKGS